MVVIRKTPSGNDQRLLLRYKIVTETINSDTVQTLDNNLQFNLKANRVYAFDGWILMNSVAAANFRYEWSIPAGGTMFWDYILNAFPALANTQLTTTLLGTLGTNQYTQFRGKIEIVTGGIWGFTWSQGTSNAGDTSLLRGSWIRLLELGA